MTVKSPAIGISFYAMPQEKKRVCGKSSAPCSVPETPRRHECTNYPTSVLALRLLTNPNLSLLDSSPLAILAKGDGM